MSPYGDPSSLSIHISCCTRALFLSAIARAASRRISEAQLFEEANSRARLFAGEKERSWRVGVFVLVLVVVEVGVWEVWWWCW